MAASVYCDQGYFIFGGSNIHSHAAAWANIGRLDAVERTWSYAGAMKYPRKSHSVRFDGNQFLVVGGTGPKNTENCILNGKTVTCTDQTGDYSVNEKNRLDNYQHPELALVDDNYGSDC